MSKYVERFYDHGREQRKIARGETHTGNYLQDFNNLVMKDLPAELAHHYNKDHKFNIWHHKIPVAQLYPVTRRIDPNDMDTIQKVQGMQKELNTYLGGNPKAGLWVPHKEHLTKIHPLYRQYGVEPGSQHYSKLRMAGLKGKSRNAIQDVSINELLDALHEYIEFAGPRSNALINMGLDPNIVKGKDKNFYKKDSGKIVTLDDVLEEESSVVDQLKKIAGISDVVQIGNNPRISSPGNNY